MKEGGFNLWNSLAKLKESPSHVIHQDVYRHLKGTVIDVSVAYHHVHFADIYSVYKEGEEHDVHEFLLSALDYMNKELKG